MIGRFSSLGVYQDLFTARKFYTTMAGGAAALAGFILQSKGIGPEALAIALIFYCPLVLMGCP